VTVSIYECNETLQFTVIMYFGMIGAFLFILIQLILIVDFAHSWADKWVTNYQETGSRGWFAGDFFARKINFIEKYQKNSFFVALLGVTSIFYLISIGCIALFYIHYTKVQYTQINQQICTNNR